MYIYLVNLFKVKVLNCTITTAASQEGLIKYSDSNKPAALNVHLQLKDCV